MRGIAIIPSEGFKFKYQLSSSVQEDPRQTLMATYLRIEASTQTIYCIGGIHYVQYCL